MNLTCVKCNSVLDKRRVGTVEVDVCPSCGGLWLDRGEIERISNESKGSVDELRRVLTGGSQAGLSDTPTACPACPGALVEVKLGHVLIDFCKKCHGVFLDRGELDAAMAAIHGTSLEQVIALAGSVSR